MKKLLFLYNTHAGKGLLKSRLAAEQTMRSNSPARAAATAVASPAP